MTKKWKNNTSKLHYIKPHIEEWEITHNSCRQHKIKLNKVRIGHNRLTHRHLMTRNDQKPTCTNVTCRNQKLTTKHCLEKCPKRRKLSVILVSINGMFELENRVNE